MNADVLDRVNLEARILQWRSRITPIRGSFKAPDDVTAQHPDARVALQQTYPALDALWTTLAIPCGIQAFANDFSIPYGDPDPNWVTFYTRRTGGRMHYANFVRVGQWVNFGGGGCKTTLDSAQHDDAVAGFIRVVRG